MSRSRESRLARLERVADQVERLNAPVAAVADEEGGVAKLMRPGWEFEPASAGMTAGDLPGVVKVYLFDPSDA
ncbi:MAG: hypothetical protein K2X38_03245 [Gemmataceae bacterium]|nr:hypothetical protein [Gemmataceae bacterium]